MFTITYWLSQVILIIAYAILGLGFQKEKKLQILTFSTIYQFLMIMHYSLLSGIAGIIASVIALVRNLIFINNEKKGKNNPAWILILFCVIAIISTILIYSSVSDILPCILTLLGIYSYWSINTKIIRIGNLLISICYILYGISLNSWLTIFCELYIIINTIIGYLKYEHCQNA